MTKGRLLVNQYARDARAAEEEAIRQSGSSAKPKWRPGFSGGVWELTDVVTKYYRATKDPNYYVRFDVIPRRICHWGTLKFSWTQDSHFLRREKDWRQIFTLVLLHHHGKLPVLFAILELIINWVVAGSGTDEPLQTRYLHPPPDAAHPCPNCK